MGNVKAHLVGPSGTYPVLLLFPCLRGKGFGVHSVKSNLFPH